MVKRPRTAGEDLIASSPVTSGLEGLVITALTATFQCDWRHYTVGDFRELSPIQEYVSIRDNVRTR